MFSLPLFHLLTLVLPCVNPCGMVFLLFLGICENKLPPS